MTKTELKALVAQALDIEVVGDDFDFSQSEAFDSFAVMSLVSLLHKALGLTFSGQALAALTTLDSLIELIGKDRISNV
jgi:acyl carrier protein